MLIKVAWRNIWRNPTRSFVVIGAICVGIWAAISMTGFATGMINNYIENSINDIISHIQIHDPEHIEDYNVIYDLENVQTIETALQQNDLVTSYAVRGLTNAMLSSPKGVRGIRAKAIHPVMEAQVTRLDQKIVEGSYLDDSGRNPILVSERIAEKIHLELRDKVVLTLQDLDGQITAASFRIVGIFDTGNNIFDDFHLFIRSDDFSRLIEDGDTSSGIVHEIAVLLRDREDMHMLQEELKDQFPELSVQTYREIAPSLQLYESQIHLISYIYLIIIMLALVFGIVNTMLMAVLERTHEFGMLMAIGMKKFQVFLMVICETLFLSFLAVPFGLAMGYATIEFLKKYGINLSAYSESLQNYGISEIIYFEVTPIVYLQVPLAVMLTALISSIYPSLKAVRLKPVDAIRKM
jgi:putative ABC transport system permease protein